MLIELLRPTGAELARRWVAALLVVDERDREAMVAAIEKRVVELYGIARDYPARAKDAEELTVVHAPVQRPGYVEHVETTYSKAVPSRPERVAKAELGKKAQGKSRKRRA